MGGYFFRQAWQNLKQNIWINAVTLGTIVISFIILGFFLVVFVNADGLLEEWKSRIRVTAYLPNSLTTEQIKQLQDRILSWPEVQGIGFRSKEEALKALEGRLPGRKGLLKGIPRNPLPASLEIQLKPGYRNSIGVEQLVERMRGNPQIEGLQYGAEWVEKFSAFLILVQVLGLGLGGLLFVSTFLVIANTIRLNIFARQEEIEIMRSIGATGFFIRAPFYIAGVFQGILGAGLAVLILFFFFRLFLREVYDPLKPILGDLAINFLSAEQTTAMVLGGLVIGFLGTQVAVGRFLRI